MNGQLKSNKIHTGLFYLLCAYTVPDITPPDSPYIRTSSPEAFAVTSAMHPSITSNASITKQESNAPNTKEENSKSKVLVYHFNSLGSSLQLIYTWLPDSVSDQK